MPQEMNDNHPWKKDYMAFIHDTQRMKGKANRFRKNRDIKDSMDIRANVEMPRCQECRNMKPVGKGHGCIEEGRSVCNDCLGRNDDK